MGIVYMFQSTPPAEARGDINGLVEEVAGQGFNPLPPPKRGETSNQPWPYPMFQTCFNPLPPPKRGETSKPSRPYSRFN